MNTNRPCNTRSGSIKQTISMSALPTSTTKQSPGKDSYVGPDAGRIFPAAIRTGPAAKAANPWRDSQVLSASMETANKTTGHF